MTRARRVSARMAVGIAAGGVAVCAALTSTPVAADPTFQVTNPELESEYGIPWAFQVTATETRAYNEPWSIAASMQGAPSGYAPTSYAYTQADDTTIGSVAPSNTMRALEVGTYPVTLTLMAPGNIAVTTTTAELTITPARLGIELLLLPDPSNTDNAVLSARFTGQFASNYLPSTYPGAGLSPAGTWNVVIKDSAGAAVLEQEIDRLAGDDVLAISAYWKDAQAGERYVAHVTFTPSGDSVKNFDVTGSNNVDYTAPPPARPAPESTASPAPFVADPAAAGPSLPLWSLLAAALAGLGLAGALIVQLARNPRRLRSSESTPGVVELGEPR